MVKFVFLTLMFVSTAFAGEVLNFTANFNVGKCWLEEGVETCESTVQIPAPETSISIELRSDSADSKRGDIELIQLTDAGEFKIYIVVTKTNKTYTLSSEFIDPDGYSTQNESISFTRPSEIQRSTFEGSIWNLGNQTYLAPFFSIGR